jgi:hypothetical protein
MQPLSELLNRLAVPVPQPSDRESLLFEFSAAPRRAGKRSIAWPADAGLAWPLATRSDELYRIALLVGAAEAPDLVELATSCFRAGDNEERRAVLRALPLLPEPARFVDLAVDACRTNVVPIFEAIACENPFPARHFPELHYNQMVLKAVFLGVRLARVIGLGERLTPELARMADDYAAERRAAGRNVPEDLALLAYPPRR